MELASFGALCDGFLQYTHTSAKGAERIDLVFDSYTERSIKNSERQRRETTQPIDELHTINRETPLPVEMNRFWASSKNEQKLQSLLHQEALKQAPSNVQIVVSHIAGEIGLPCYSTTAGLTPEVELEMEEADDRTFPHAMHAVKHGIDRLVIPSADTDVFILMTYYWNELKSSGLQGLWVKAGVGESTRFIPVHTLATRIVSDLCEVLPAVHTLTGCDYISKVGTKQAALKANPENYSKDFGKMTPDMETVIKTSEEYLTKVLQKGTPCKSSDQLRSHIYHQSKGVDFDQLPPTSHSMEAHIRRAFLATNQIVSLLSAKPDKLEPTQFGFEENEELLITNMAKRPIP